MIKIRHIAAIFLTAILLPLMDRLSMFCFGVSMKGAIVKDMDRFFEKRADDIIQKADEKRNIIKLVFSVETDAEELNELEKTSLSVNIAEKLADYQYCQKESIQSKNNTSWAHTFTLKIIISNEGKN